jgi:N-acetylmuramoyl-L-alanine amidase
VLRTSVATQKKVSSKRYFTFKKLNRKQVRHLLVGVNLSVVVSIGVGLYFLGNNSSVPINASASSNRETDQTVDKLSSADIAVNISRITALDESVAVSNAADTANAQIAISSNDNTVLQKPQVLAASAKSRKDIQKYIVQPGETVSTVAGKFGVTSETIRYSNGLNTEIVPAGKELIVSPVNGVVYTVSAGDTPDSIATKFGANKDQIVAFNDAEATGTFKPGEQIVVPEGRIIATTAAARGRTGDALGAGRAVGFSFGTGPVYGGNNGYDYGYCTYWSALRRAQVGMPIPSNLGNAVSWKTLAARAGYAVSGVPKQYAVIWFPTGGYGHVGFVEAVNADGSISISEMNAAGWNKVSYATIPASQVGKYSYIY